MSAISYLNPNTGVSGAHRSSALDQAPARTGGGNLENRLQAIPGVENMSDEQRQVAMDKMARMDSFRSLAKDPDALSRALIDMAQSQRQNAVDQRASARESARNELLDAAGKSKDAAAEQQKAANASLAAGVVAGAVSMGMSITSGVINVKGINAGNKAAASAGDAAMYKGIGGAELGKIKSEAFTAAAQGSTATANAVNTGAQGVSGLINAAGQGAAGNMNARASELQAEGQAIQAEAQDTQSEKDLEKKFADELDAAVQSAIQFAKAMQDAEVERMAAITRSGA